MRVCDIRRDGVDRMAAIATLFFVCLALAAVSAPASAATITVINDDPAGVGFNDSTPRAAGGGNPGTTLGERRMFAFNYAAALIGDKIRSGVEIRVRASFGPLTCDATSATLGQASPLTSMRNFGAGQSNTLYPIALANALAGTDLLPPGNPQGAPEADIGAQFNGDIDDNPDCLQGVDWYYGVDGNRPNRTVDFLATVTHELIHGLGFLSFVNLSNGEFPVDTPGIFDRFIRDLDRNALWPDLTANQRALSATNEGRVVWDGSAVTNNGAPTLSAGTSGGQVLLYTPSDLEQGSSVSHWDSSLVPNAIMEPNATGDIDVNDGIGLETCLLRDIGWLLTVGTACPDQSGAGAPSLAVTPGSVDFGTITADETDTRTVTVENDGPADLQLQTITAPAAPFSIQSQTCSEGMTLMPGMSCDLTMRFAPQQAGDFSDSLGIGSDGGNAMVPLTGTAKPAPAPDIAVTPTMVGFGDRTVGSSSTRTVTVENQGDAGLNIGNIGSLVAPFSLPAGEDNCSGTTVNPGAQCAFKVVFGPTSAGSFSDQLTVPSNDQNVRVSVSGSASEASQPNLVVSPNTLNFGAVTVGETATGTVTVANDGSEDLNLQSIGEPTAPFSIQSQTCSEGMTLIPGQSCGLTLRFAPQQAGVFSDSLGLGSNGGNAAVTLTGEGVPAPAPDISVNPAAVDFGERIVGSSTARTVTVENQGNAALNIGSIGTLAAPYSLPAGSDGCSDSSLNAGAQCQFSVVFTPGTTGNFSDQLTVPSNDGNVTVPVSGTAAEAPVPNIDVDPTPVAFGAVAVGGAVTRTITVRNTGGTALNLGDVPDNQIPVDPFAITSQDCSGRQLAVGAACKIVVRFGPTSQGMFNDSLDIASDDPDSPNVEVALTGQGGADPDDDGVASVIEDAAPNGGDGNDDGIADSMQPAVVSLPGVRGGFVTLAADAGKLVDVRAVKTPENLQLPEGVEFDNGFFGFEVDGLSPGAGVQVTLILHDTSGPDAYYKFDDQMPGGGMAVRFDFDALSGTGAQIEANRVVLNLVDGERGDGDLSVNGRIRDPGGPGFAENADVASAGSGQSSGGGGGGGCALSADVRTPAPLLWLLTAWALIGLYRGRRRRGVPVMGR